MVGGYLLEKVLIASGSPQAIDLLTQLLKSTGYSQIVNVESGSEARRLINQNQFELVVINSPLSDEFGHELAISVTEKTSSSVILICKAEISDDVSEKLSIYGVCVIPKPLNKNMFYHSVKLVSANRARMITLMDEYNKLQTKMEETKLVNRAKCVLIQNLKLTESQAHRYIEKQAMDTRQTKKEIAQKILTTYEM